MLQGVLNSIPGVLVRGENYDFCYHLFQAYQSIVKTKTQEGQLSQNPFYGSNFLDELYFLEQAKETVRNLLLGDKKNNSKIKCYGFKEIRYHGHLDDLAEYLAFLEKIFPNPCFIVNTRNKEAVVKSTINVKWFGEEKKDMLLEKLEQVENKFSECMKAYPNNSFHITYEEVTEKKENLTALFTFLGATFDEKKIEEVLSLRHSYSPLSDKVQQLKYK